MYDQKIRIEAEVCVDLVYPDFFNVMNQSHVLCLDGSLEAVLFTVENHEVTRLHLLQQVVKAF